MTGVIGKYLLMTKWSGLSYRPFLVLYGAIQIMTTVGFVIGMSFFFPEMNPTIARYLVTGAPTLILLFMGLSLVPQNVAYGRLQGTYDFQLSLPVQRMVLLFSDATIFFLITLPGIVTALFTGSIYHDFPLRVCPLVIPAFLLISLTGTFLGYALALAVPRPRMTGVVTQVLVFIFVFFSPVIYPAEQLPGWVAAVHRILPVQYMADLSRGTLSDINVDLGRAFAVTGAYCVAGFIFCYIVMKKRG